MTGGGGAGRWRSAAEIVGHLGGKWRGRKGRCRCPVTTHSSDSKPLAVTQTENGQVLVKCFAGCDQNTVVAALRLQGLWGDGEPVMHPLYPGYVTTKQDTSRSADDRRMREYAQSIWDAAKPAKGSPVEAYLRARGIRLPVSDQLRYAPRLKHTEANQTFPAMIARVADDRGFCAIQRTYLDPQQPAKATLPDGMKAKLSLAALDHGAVRLREPKGDTLGLAEGIETALSAAQMYALPVWATLSAMRLRQIDIPASIKILHLFADPGDVGRKEAFRAADEYEAKGYHTEIYFPAAHFRSGANDDFNSVLQAGAMRA